MHASVDLGPVAQYTSGAFQSKLSVPRSFDLHRPPQRLLLRARKRMLTACIYICNLRFLYIGKPLITLRSTLMLNYSASETPWRKLLTANVMQNYRSLSRYRATLDNSYDAGAYFKVAFKDIFTSVFAHLEGNWQRFVE